MSAYRKPKFDGRDYDLIWQPGTDRWFVVFPSAIARMKHKYISFKGAKVTSVLSFADAYIVDTDFVLHMGWQNTVPTRHRSERPRLGEMVMDLTSTVPEYGYITYFDWKERQTTVQYGEIYSSYPMGDFNDEICWTDKHGGMWVKEKHR